jgi:transcriptional regulator GlxA family with amidase domain
VCNVNHAAPFTFESTTPRDSFLVISCTGGAGTLWSADTAVPVSGRLSVPISAAGIAGISGEPALSHFSVHFSAERVYALCAQEIGSPLQQPLVFDLTPFAPELAFYWRRIINAMDALMEMETPPSIAVTSLREHAIGLLLESHPHNYSRFLLGHLTPPVQVVREAMRLMEEQADFPVTVADIAGTLGCTSQSLHRGFLEYERTTPHAFLYAVRLKRVRAALTVGATAGSAADIACQYGFVNYERFSTGYSERYGESPDDTLHRYHSPRDADSGPNLTEAKAEMLRAHIEAHISSRIRVPSLAKMAGMSVQNFIVAFTRMFGTTPAQYVIEKRLGRARWLLVNSRETISTIAAETGFASQSHLTTALKRHEGLTPIQYRRSCLK